MTIDKRLEQKLGFDRVRQIISDRCSTAYATERTATETFSTDPAEIRRRLVLTDEMRLIMMFEDSFPSGGFIDCIDFLKPLERSSSAIDLISLRKLRTMLDTLRKVTNFFEGIKTKYGSIETFLSQRIGLDEDKLKKLKEIHRTPFNNSVKVEIDNSSSESCKHIFKKKLYNLLPLDIYACFLFIPHHFLPQPFQ